MAGRQIFVSVEGDLRRLDRILTNVRNLRTNQDFVKRVKTKDLADEALRFLKSRFPRSTKSNGSINAIGEHLSDGWKVFTDATGDRIEFGVTHDWWDAPKVRKVLKVLDTGKKKSSYLAKETFTFFSEKLDRWVSVKKGRRVHQPARKGHKYIESTYAFITLGLLPELRQRVRDEFEKEALA